VGGEGAECNARTEGARLEGELEVYIDISFDFQVAKGRVTFALTYGEP